MDRIPSSDHDESLRTPKSTKITKKEIHLKKLNQVIPFSLQNCKTFVFGISGGDCAGKRQMIQYMFDKKGDKWVIKGSDEPVTIIHQGYFIKTNNGQRYTAKGIDWDLFSRQVVSLLIGN